jgi:hypothetical protein
VPSDEPRWEIIHSRISHGLVKSYVLWVGDRRGAVYHVPPDGTINIQVPGGVSTPDGRTWDVGIYYNQPYVRLAADPTLEWWTA